MIVNGKTDTTLLVDIYSRLGSVEGQNEMILKSQADAREDRQAVYQNIDKLRVEVAASAHAALALALRVTDMEPEVAKSKNFRAQLAVMVFVVTGVVTGAINLIMLAVSNLQHIKDSLRAFMR
jgi:hypothetical protein